jgi:type I restriction enzyme M protein
MDAAEYKHVVLGLIFLKYISDAFEEKHAALEADRKGGADPEDPDEYRAVNIFWVPPEARWAKLKAEAKQPAIGKTVDEAMLAIERDNPTLKGVLPKDYAHPRLDKQRLGQLIDLIGNIGLGDKENRSKDILGRVYEYFLSEFASAEGKKGGQFYTPRCVVRLLVEPRLRSLLRVRRHVRAVREVHRGARRQDRRHQRLWPGVEPHDLAAGQDEPCHPRHRLEPRQGTRR